MEGFCRQRRYDRTPQCHSQMHRSGQLPWSCIIISTLTTLSVPSSSPTCVQVWRTKAGGCRAALVTAAAGTERKTYPRRTRWKGVRFLRVWRPRFRQASGLGRMANAVWMSRGLADTAAPSAICTLVPRPLPGCRHRGRFGVRRDVCNGSRSLPPMVSEYFPADFSDSFSA